MNTQEGHEACQEHLANIKENSTAYSSACNFIVLLW